MKRILHKQEIEDIIKGATLLGAGGGGSAGPALRLVEEIREVTLVEPEDVSDDSNVAVVAGMGSPVVLLKEGWRGEEVPALERFEEATGKKVDYVVPVEMGGFNSITPIHAAALKGLPVIDGDGAGRAIPELQMTMFYIHGIPISPLSLADSKGNSAILYPTDAYMAEELGRAVTTVFGMTAGIACHPMTGKQLKEAVIPGTLSLAEKVGKGIREAKESGKDVVKAATQSIEAIVLARGKVAKKTEEVRAGFDYGRVFVEDIVVDYKNENMIAWRKDKPIVMVPDSICWLTTDGEPLTNADIKEGLEVAVLVRKAHEKWRVPRGFDVFRHVLKLLGYEGEYKPIEKLWK
jgi:DUF917 family protein